MYPPGMQTVCEEQAAKWGVVSEIHPEDQIFSFILQLPQFATKERAVEYYFEDGANSAKRLADLLRSVCGFQGGGCQLLEFASGYGCVTRHLKKTIPLCDVTACDIHPPAMEFLKSKLGISTVLSTHRPEDLQLPPTFDVVFALSFFSHMPKSTFGKWLRQLASFVKPGGYFILTTHGLVSWRSSGRRRRFDSEGFYFGVGSEQDHLDAAEYGCAIVKPGYVFNHMLKLDHWTPVFFQEASWWGHQDLFVWRRLADPLTVPAIFSPLPSRISIWRHRIRQMLKSRNR
jgi:SAM-dependent methyltransferase